MKYFADEKDDFQNIVFMELKNMGVKVPKMKKIKFNCPKQERCTLQSIPKIFGVSLSDQEWTSTSLLPKFMWSCTSYLQGYSKEVGLFRKAGSIARQRDLRVKLENGGSVDGSEPNDIASLLKQWLRELPEPLIPCYLHDLFTRCQELNNDESCVTSSLLVCLLLPPDHLQALKHLMCFLADIAANSNKNKMGARNLALIMTPNIFVLKSSSVDKSSNDKVQLYTTVIQLLIENADKIGENPLPLTVQHSSKERKSGSELDSMGDLMESSPCKSRKKYLLRSIKKLVKQNSTPASSSTQVTPEFCRNSISASPRQTVALINGDEACSNDASETKENGNSFGSNTFGDTCKRSFGLLRRKERKRLKSSKECLYTTKSLDIQNPPDSKVVSDTANVDLAIQEPSLKNVSDIGTSPHLDKLLECGNIEKTASNCPNCHFELHDKYLASSIPKSTIQSYQDKIEVAFKKSRLEEVVEEIEVCQSQELELLQLDITTKERSDKRSSSLQEVELQNLIEMSNSTTLLLDPKLSKDKTLLQCKTPEVMINCLSIPQTSNLSSADNQIVNSAMSEICCSRMENEIISQPEHNSAKIGKWSMKDNINADLDSLQLEDSKHLMTKNFNKESQNSSTRPDTIIRPKHKSLIDEVERFDTRREKNKKALKYQSVTNEAQSNHLQNSRRAPLNLKNKADNKNATTRDRRKTSHRLEKINTFSPESDKFLNVKSEKIVLQNEENATLYDLSCTNTINLNRKEETILGDHSVSQSSTFEDLNFNSPIVNEGNLCFKKHSIKNTNKKNESSVNNIEDAMHVETTQWSKRKLLLSRKPIMTSSHSDSKIPRLKNSFRVDRTNSFTELVPHHKQKVCKPTSNTDFSDHSTKLPVKCNDSINGLSTLELSMNDSCFKTPTRNVLYSPNSVTWMSGNKYFDFNSPEQEEQFNKRESIAMILKNNPGHVQAKVHLYDDIVHKSVNCTQSVPGHSTPNSNYSMKRSESINSLKSAPKERTKLQNSKSILYSKSSLANRNNHARHRGKSEKSPPHPHPRYVTQSNTPSPIKNHTLKDITNSSFGLNGSKTSLNNSQLKNKIASVISNENNIGQIKSGKISKRNSFSGNTPYKLPKRVSRSESSPGCPRPYYRVSCLIQEST